jgi:hypothetical protein
MQEGYIADFIEENMKVFMDNFSVHGTCFESLLKIWKIFLKGVEKLT